MPGVGNHPVNYDIAKQLRKIRMTKGLTPEHLAALVCTDPREVVNYERGSKIISAAYLYLFARALNAPIGEFFEGIAPEQPLVGVAELNRRRRESAE